MPILHNARAAVIEQAKLTGTASILAMKMVDTRRACSNRLSATTLPTPLIWSARSEPVSWLMKRSM